MDKRIKELCKRRFDAMDYYTENRFKKSLEEKWVLWRRTIEFMTHIDNSIVKILNENRIQKINNLPPSFFNEYLEEEGKL